MAKEKPPQAVVKKNVGAIHIEAKLSLVERRLSNALLFNAYENLLLKRKHSIDIKTMSSLIGFNSKNTNELKEALTKLSSTPIKWNSFDDKGREKWGVSALLASGVIENGVCTYEYSEALAEKLYNPEIYARINLSVQKNISSSYTLVIYETCLRYLGVGSTGLIEIDKLRGLLGVSGSQNYSNFKRLSEKIIRPAIKEINVTTNIFIETEYTRLEQVVTHIRFRVKENPQLNLLDSDLGDEVVQNEAYKALLKVGYPKALARRWFEEYGEAYIVEKLEITNTAKASGKVKSVSGFLTKAIEGNYQSAEVIEKKAVVEAKRKREQRQAIERQIERLRADILTIERQNRQERSRLVEAHIKSLASDEEASLREAFASQIAIEANAGDFRKKGWQSIVNLTAIATFVGARYKLELPSSDDTALSLKLLTIPELNRKIGEFTKASK